jgi:predicted secreted protein
MANIESNKIAFGGDMMIFLASSGTTYPIAFSTDAKMDITVNTREISSKDSGYWTEIAAGKISWNASTDALYSYELSSGTTRNTFDELYSLMVARETVLFAFAKTSGATPNWSVDSGAVSYTGQALITGISVNAPNDESTTYSITLEGNGELSQNT